MLGSGADPRAGQDFLPTKRTSAHFALRIFFLPGTSPPSGKQRSQPALLAQQELGSGLGGLTHKCPHPKAQWGSYFMQALAVEHPNFTAVCHNDAH